MKAAEARAIVDQLGLSEYVASVAIPPLTEDQRTALAGVFGARRSNDPRPLPSPESSLPLPDGSDANTGPETGRRRMTPRGRRDRSAQSAGS